MLNIQNQNNLRYSALKKQPSFQAKICIEGAAEAHLVNFFEAFYDGATNSERITHFTLKPQKRKKIVPHLEPEKIIRNFSELFEKETDGVDGTVLISLRRDTGHLNVGYRNPKGKEFFGTSSDVFNSRDFLPNERYDSGTPGMGTVMNIVSRVWGVLKERDFNGDNPFNAVYERMFKQVQKASNS